MSILIIGCGEIGQFIAEELIRENRDVVIIDKNERVVDEIRENLDAKFIIGNGAAPHVLHEAGLTKAEMVISVTDSDEVNLLTTILAGMEAPQAIRIARIRNPEFDIEEEKFQQDLNINLVINPDKEAAKAIGKILQVPGSHDIIDFFGGRLRVVGTKVRGESGLVGKRLKDLTDLRVKKHFLIAAIVRGNDFMIPTGEDEIRIGDEVYFVADRDNVFDGMKLLGYRLEKIDNIIIHGGGFIGRNLAASLEQRGVNVKLIEPDPKICSVASRMLDKTIILNAQGTDQDLLEEENIGRMDAFVAVTKDDEDNIISALLAKRLGCPMSIALTHKTAYQPLVSAIGVDVVINPRQIANSTILQFLRKGRILHVSSIKAAAEIIEMEALETSDIVGKPLSKLKLPEGVLVISIFRKNEIIVPWGSTTIEPGDNVILIAKREAISKLEKFMTVKLEYF